jgi:ARMET, C-terminal
MYTPIFAKLQQMRVSEMRDMLSELGSECKGCSEKPEFVAALQQAVAARR